MYTDIPELTRCCFCAPLRIGLLAWGYIKLIFSMIMLILILINAVEMVYNARSMPIGLIIFIIAELIDEIFTVILVVAAHKRHEKLFKIYYVYTIVYLVFLSIVGGLQCIYLLVITVSFPHPYLVNILLMVFGSTVSLLVIQVYIVLLVRSELHKLRDRANIQFFNQAGEAQCNAYVNEA